MNVGNPQISDTQALPALAQGFVGGAVPPPAQQVGAPLPHQETPYGQQGEDTGSTVTTLPLTVDPAEQRRLTATNNLRMAVQAFTAGNLSQGHTLVSQTLPLLTREQFIDAMLSVRANLTGSMMPHPAVYCAVYETGLRMQFFLSGDDTRDRSLTFLTQDVELYAAIAASGGYVDPTVEVTSRFMLALATGTTDPDEIAAFVEEVEKVTASDLQWHIQVLQTVAMRAALVRPVAAWLLDEHVKDAIAKLGYNPPMLGLMARTAQLVGTVRTDEQIDKEVVNLLLQRFKDVQSLTSGDQQAIPPLVSQAMQLLGEVMKWTREPREDKYWKPDHGPLTGKPADIAVAS